MKIIGIDGGGTKTKFVLYTSDGKVLKECTYPSCHILQVEEEVSKDILRKGIEELVTKDEEVMIVAGLAGYGQNQVYRQKIEKICSQAFDHPYRIYNDVEIAVEAALGGNDGIVVIAGTGSIAFCKHNGETKRCGGWGYALGDEGSAYWIARKLLEKFCKQADGRMEKTVLYDKVMEKCNLQNDFEMITYMNDVLKKDREKVAKLAVIAYEAAMENDPVALDIYQQSADEIVSLIKTLQKSFDSKVQASYIGGVFKAGSLLLDRINDQLENVDLHEPLYPAEYGAYLLGIK